MPNCTGSKASSPRLVLACVRKLVDGFDDRAKAEATVRSALKQMRREKRAELRVAPSLWRPFQRDDRHHHRSIP